MIEIQLPEDPVDLVRRAAVAFVVGQFFWQHSNGDWITMLFTTIIMLFMKSVK